MLLKSYFLLITSYLLFHRIRISSCPIDGKIEVTIVRWLISRNRWDSLIDIFVEVFLSNWSIRGGWWVLSVFFWGAIKYFRCSLYTLPNYRLGSVIFLLNLTFQLKIRFHILHLLFNQQRIRIMISILMALRKFQNTWHFLHRLCLIQYLFFHFIIPFI